MAQIDYFFSVFSPWTYLAGDRLEQIAAKHGATITYKPLDLLTLFDRTGGVRPAARHPSRMDYRMQELERWSKHLNMEMNFKPVGYPPNGAPGSYAVIAAQAAGGGDLGALVRGIARAVWVEDRNIGEDDVLREKLEEAGFDPNLVTTGLFTGAMAYERNLEEAVERGVFGSPFYIVAETDQRFWGQDRLDFLDAHLGTL
ncbi:2-hydroxychromene-2-carboxylate isomerase [Rhodobacter aestuarii]|uniref:2-hydroxychromene-2-carboxylate isomerase n=1 Tax=Rhodobacter aestuarii TaxID=453582 RepID=A0A1N7MPC1_9RHOB|nr:2-hydroxychromene-2-carboxylate isomerase [Rhodobacter aestuarii]PTV96625.1 2-hydroxychromene-2-carboxylate isomerase [Rhodobacter aestuarii]SIS87994.1 2-hydroxychromene-2-carboxylate isomerase [Rhodobacter aestuarii]